MSKDEGILIYLDEQKRRDVIIDRIDDGALTFSDTLSLLDWELKQIDLALLAFSENTIDLPRVYMNYLVSEHGPKGPRDGKVISFKNAPRYLTNSEFVNSVNRGWIGTCGIRSSVLKDLIKRFYTNGKNVLLAYESKMT